MIQEIILRDPLIVFQLATLATILCYFARLIVINPQAIENGNEALRDRFLVPLWCSSQVGKSLFLPKKSLSRQQF